MNAMDYWYQKALKLEEALKTIANDKHEHWVNKKTKQVVREKTTEECIKIANDTLRQTRASTEE